LKPYVLALANLALAGLALGACEQGKPRHPPPDPLALATLPGQAAVGPAGALSVGLAKRPEAAGFFLDHAGAAVDPRSRQPAVTAAGQPTIFDGFGFDAPAKLPAKGVDVVVDGKAYGATYGTPRPDVAKFFNAPGLVNVGFRTILPAGSLAVGAHTVLVRVVAADGKGYFDSPAIAFSAN
jgi:hypothetical protein